MGTVLYELAAEDDARFSPYCWRTRFALAHKELTAEARGLRFLEIPEAFGAPHRTVPILDDGGNVVSDSWAIANYLEERYPSAPSLWNHGASAKGLYHALDAWANQVLVPAIVPLVVLDIHGRIHPDDRPYFRESREKRVGPLEKAAGDDPQSRVENFRKLLAPVRQAIERQKWLGGSEPDYADYIIAGTLQWPRVISPRQLLPENAAEDPVVGWFERCLDLFDGLGRRMPAAAAR